jgi:plasmid stabilization system protein ParE
VKTLHELSVEKKKNIYKSKPTTDFIQFLYLAPMNRHELLISEKAVESFQEIIAKTQEVSLISAEKVRQKILHKIHFVGHHPQQGTRQMELPAAFGHVRTVLVLNYKIIFKVEENKVTFLDMLVDKNRQAE